MQKPSRRCADSALNARAAPPLRCAPARTRPVFYMLFACALWKKSLREPVPYAAFDGTAWPARDRGRKSAPATPKQAAPCGPTVSACCPPHSAGWRRDSAKRKKPCCCRASSTGSNAWPLSPNTSGFFFEGSPQSAGGPTANSCFAAFQNIVDTWPSSCTQRRRTHPQKYPLPKRPKMRYGHSRTAPRKAGLERRLG